MNRRRISLQHYTMLIVGIPLLCQLLVGLYFGFVSGRDKILATLSTTIEERTARQATELGVFFSDMARRADGLAATVGLAMLTPEQEMLLTREILQSEALAACIIASAINPQSGTPYRNSPYSMRKNGVAKQAYLISGRSFGHDIGYTFMDWFLLPHLAGHGMWTEPFYSKSQDGMVVMYGAPINANGIFQGVVSIATPLHAITDVLHKTNSSGGQQILISQFGTIITHPDESLILRHTLVSLAYAQNRNELRDLAYSLRGKRSTGVVRLREGLLSTNEFVAYAPVPNTDWVLLSVTAEAKALEPLWETLAIWVVVTVGCALALFIAIYSLETFKVVRPIQNLTLATRRLARGDFVSRVPETADTYELNHLQQSFNSMAAQLERSMNREIEAGRARLYAEEASRAKTDFLARMSHEIRTPMNAILGFTHLAIGKTSSSEQHNFLKKIQNAGNHMLSLLNDILDFSKIEAGMLELEHAPFSFHDVAADLRDMFAHAASERGLSFSVDIDPALPHIVNGDALRITQIFINLCNNALKFTSSGSICVSIRHAGDDDGKIRIEACVQDTGIGISAADQKKLFTKFSQADSSITRKFGGTGLGLAICRLLVDLMDGTICLESTEGLGTTFTVSFICTPGPENLAPRTASSTLESPETEHTLFAAAYILVAEDNEINQEIIGSFLDDFGIEYSIADDGEQAIAHIDKANATGRPYNLVLMDMQMPRLDGLATTLALRKKGYLMPILAMTANALPIDRLRCLEAGMNDHLAKPLDPAKTRALLVYWLSKTHADTDKESAYLGQN